MLEDGTHVLAGDAPTRVLTLRGFAGVVSGRAWRWCGAPEAVAPKQAALQAQRRAAAEQREREAAERAEQAEEQRADKIAAACSRVTLRIDACGDPTEAQIADASLGCVIWRGSERWYADEDEPVSDATIARMRAEADRFAARLQRRGVAVAWEPDADSTTC